LKTHSEEPEEVISMAKKPSPKAAAKSAGKMRSKPKASKSAARKHNAKRK
jgi:hypothetical protein